MSIDVMREIEGQYEKFLIHTNLRDHPVLWLGFLTAVKSAHERRELVVVADVQKVALLNTEIERLTNEILNAVPR